MARNSNEIQRKVSVTDIKQVTNIGLKLVQVIQLLFVIYSFWQAHKFCCCHNTADSDVTCHRCRFKNIQTRRQIRKRFTGANRAISRETQTLARRRCFGGTNRCWWKCANSWHTNKQKWTTARAKKQAAPRVHDSARVEPMFMVGGDTRTRDPVCVCWETPSTPASTLPLAGEWQPSSPPEPRAHKTADWCYIQIHQLRVSLCYFADIAKLLITQKIQWTIVFQ